MGSFLTKENLIELTGAQQRAKQIRNLKENGISFTIGTDGWPRVLWGNLERYNPQFNKTKKQEPDLEWIDG